MRIFAKVTKKFLKNINKKPSPRLLVERGGEEDACIPRKGRGLRRKWWELFLTVFSRIFESDTTERARERQRVSE